MCKSILTRGIDTIGVKLFENIVSPIIENSICESKGHSWRKDGKKKKTKYCNRCGLIVDNKETKENTAKDYHDETWNKYQSKIRQEYYSSYNPSGKD